MSLYVDPPQTLVRNEIGNAFLMFVEFDMVMVIENHFL